MATFTYQSYKTVFMAFGFKQLRMFKVADSYLLLSSLQLKSGVSRLLMCGLEFEGSSEKRLVHLAKVNVW